MNLYTHTSYKLSNQTLQFTSLSNSQPQYDGSECPPPPPQVPAPLLPQYSHGRSRMSSACSRLYVSYGEFAKELGEAFNPTIFPFLRMQKSLDKPFSKSEYSPRWRNWGMTTASRSWRRRGSSCTIPPCSRSAIQYGPSELNYAEEEEKKSKEKEKNMAVKKKIWSHTYITKKISNHLKKKIIPYISSCILDLILFFRSDVRSQIAWRKKMALFVEKTSSGREYKVKNMGQADFGPWDRASGGGDARAHMKWRTRREREKKKNKQKEKACR